MKELELNNKKLHISSNSEQKKQSKENMKLYRDTRKRNFIQEYFWRSKEIRHSQRKKIR